MGMRVRTFILGAAVIAGVFAVTLLLKPLLKGVFLVGLDAAVVVVAVAAVYLLLAKAGWRLQKRTDSVRDVKAVVKSEAAEQPPAIESVAVQAQVCEPPAKAEDRAAEVEAELAELKRRYGKG